MFLSLFLTSATPADDSVMVGNWRGIVTAPDDEFSITLLVSLTTNLAGILQASLVILESDRDPMYAETVTFTDGFLQLNIPTSGITITGQLAADGQTWAGDFSVEGETVPLTLTRVTSMPELERPQNPQPPFPYLAEHVRFENTTAGVRLAGTLTRPEGAQRYPAVILIPGSGRQDRDEQGAGHRPFLILADALTRQGLAVLRFDKRGVWESTGDYAAATTQDFADDARAAVAYLKTRADINPRQIGLIGHSEGGLIAPLIAADKTAEIAWIALLAGPGLNMVEIVARQVALDAEADGMAATDAHTLETWYRQAYGMPLHEQDAGVIAQRLRAQYAELRAAEQELIGWDESQWAANLQRLVSPWWRYIISIDPQVALQQVQCPVLALNGAKDSQVSAADNLRALEQALQAGDNISYHVEELPDLNHLFQHAQTGSVAEYPTIEETFAPEALKLITNWIQRQIGQPTTYPTVVPTTEPPTLTSVPEPATAAFFGIGLLSLMLLWKKNIR